MRRALLVGAGGMGRAWAKNLAAHPDVELAGWVDVRPGAAEDAARELELEVAHCGSGFEVAIPIVAPEFVVDVTPPEVHRDITVAALGHGLPVLGEKPMAASMEQARAMVAAADRAGKLYMVSQSRRYIAEQTAFRRAIQDQLGPLGVLNADFFIGAHFGGFRDAMASPLVLDMAIHTFDQARFLSGRDPISVYAEEFNPSWSWYRGDACATALFEMEGGLRFTYRGSWCAEGLHTSWDGDWRAVGPNGSAKWEGGSVPVVQTVKNVGGFHSDMEESSPDVVPQKGGIEGSLEEFLAALGGGPVPNGECHDNIKSLAMVFAAIRSSQEGRRVPIGEVLQPAGA
ncbi:MAG: Gfo/Idh/MocA family oxidoreductase [Fimbriimonadaceae bacterium]|nr:Gfo/Idh/MocA family oxidoreductase [Fimbriimonadaceae bacterium]